MHESMLPATYGNTGAFRRPLLDYIFFGLSRRVDEDLDIFPLLRSTLPCFGLPGSCDLRTVLADVSELTAVVAFSVFLSYLGVVDFPAVIQVVIG